MTDHRIKVCCANCDGEGKLYTSRYGGNDPDVWPTGDCPVCEGEGVEWIESEPFDETDAALVDSEIFECEAAHD